MGGGGGEAFSHISYEITLLNARPDLYHAGVRDISMPAVPDSGRRDMFAV